MRRRLVIAIGLIAVLTLLPMVLAFVGVLRAEQQYRLTSGRLSMERRVTIYAPPGYDPTGERHYPVLYSLDGQSFRHARLPAMWVRLLSAIGQAPSMVVVAIDNEGVRDVDLRPPAPVPLHDDLPIAGRDAAFTEFLRDELMPFVRQRYRTSAYRIISGHSLGGLYAVERLSRSPGLFQAHFAYSPSFTHDRASLVRLQQAIAVRRQEPTLLYMNVGEEDPLTISTFGRAARLLTAATPDAQLLWRVERVRGLYHPIVMIPGQARALMLLGEVASPCALSARSDLARRACFARR